LTSHLHVSLRLRMGGAVILQRLCAFIVWTRTTAPSPLPILLLLNLFAAFKCLVAFTYHSLFALPQLTVFFWFKFSLIQLNSNYFTV
jgi:hypothetical protein